MKFIQTSLPEVLIIEPNIFGDARGFFYESFNQDAFRKATDTAFDFVQDNHSKSTKGVLRGVHYQIQQVQGKLVRVAAGEIFDVAVDLRRSSEHFGKWVGVHLSAQNHRQLWVPPGFGHGFLVVSESAEVLYKTTNSYAPQHERCIIWNDCDLAIEWPLPENCKVPLLSDKDQAGMSFSDAEVFS